MKHVRAAVARTIRRHIVLSISLAVMIILSVVLGLLPPLVLGKGVDRLGRSLPMGAALITMYYLFTAAGGIAESAREVLITVFGQKLTHEMRGIMADKLRRLPAQYYVRTDPGVTDSRFVNDVDSVETLFSSGLISMISDLAGVVGILAVIWTKSRGLFVILLIVSPILFAFTRHAQKSLLKAKVAGSTAIADANAVIPETIENIRSLHVFGAENFMERRYDRSIQRSFEANERTNFYDAVYSPVIITSGSAVIAVMMILSGQGAAFQSLFGMSAGTAVAVIAYVSKIFTPLESIGMEIQDLQTAAAGVHRIEEFMREEETGDSSQQAEMSGETNHEILSDQGTAQSADIVQSHAVAGLDEYISGSGQEHDGFAQRHEENITFEGIPAVAFAHVNFAYPGDHERSILRDFSMQVRQGEHVMIVGRTGAGKSTVLKLIMGLYRPDGGEVLVCGRPAVTVQEEERRKIFGYVEQQFVPVAGTVLEQISLGDPRVFREDAETALRTVGLSDVVKKLPEGLDTVYERSLFSQGQQQLLSIARAIALRPSILLLDEITANLDADTEAALMEALRRAGKDRTVISISHRIYEENGSRRIEIG